MDDVKWSREVTMPLTSEQVASVRNGEAVVLTPRSMGEGVPTPMFLCAMIAVRFHLEGDAEPRFVVLSDVPRRTDEEIVEQAKAAFRPGADVL